jgi:hypothetical protein
MSNKPNSVTLNKNYFYLRRIADREGAHARVLLVEVGVVGQLVDVEVILLPVSEIRETESTSNIDKISMGSYIHPSNLRNQLMLMQLI